MQLKHFMGKFFLSCTIFLAISFAGISQTDTTRKIIQFSGIAVDADSLSPIPYVAIVVRNSQRGVYSNMQGYYSIVVQEKDTVEFYALGYHNATFVVADTFSTNQYVHVQALKEDTIYLQTTVIYPWPSKEEFRNAFLTQNIPFGDLDRARSNLSDKAMAIVAENMAMDPSMVYSATAQQRVYKNYTMGGLPQNNLLNPIAWAKFIKSVQDGDYKKKQ